MPALGVTVMPEWFQHEGIEPVLDRLQGSGAARIATSPVCLELVREGEGAREPPADGEAGKVRPLDRPLFGDDASSGCGPRRRSCTTAALRGAALPASPPTR